MYWRINCTEHLLLDLNVDPKKAPRRTPTTPNNNARAGDDTNASTSTTAQRPSRPRSVTYSTGSGPSADHSFAAKQGAMAVGNDLDESTVVVRWASSPDGRFLAGITSHGVYLWSLKPFVLLSSLVYDPVEDFGQMVDVIWKDQNDEDEGSQADGEQKQAGGTGSSSGRNSAYATLFVIMSMGYIYEVAVYRRDAPVLEYQFEAQHYFARGPGEGEGLPPFGLAQRRTYRLPGSGTAVCAAAAGSEMAVVATRSHVHRLTWTGTMQSSTPVREIYDNPLAQICQIVYVGSGEGGKEEGKVEMYLFSDGSTLRAPDVAGKFTVIAYSAVSQVIAVGTSSGEVLLYTAGSDQRLDLVAKLAFDHGKAARVSALAWTQDGSALACGYSTGHVVVRSVLGYELNATRLGSQHLPEYLTPAPSLLAWATGSTRLAVFSDCLTSGDALGAQQADALPFVRAALTTVPCEGNSKRVCLFSDEKVFLYRCEFEAQDLSSQQPELLWHVAQVPTQYITSNWPVRFAAADDDGQHIAVAGRRGLACYSVDTHKWRLFRNQQQEASISCTGGLLWYREYLVVACINHEFQNTPQLLFFPRNRPLDTTSDLHTVALESPVVAMSCHNSMLLVYCRNMALYQYAIFDDMDFIQVSLRRAIDLSHTGIDPRRVRSLQWVPSALFDHRPTFLVHEGITLRIIEETPLAEDGQSEGPRYRASSVVSDRVEFTITSGVNFGNMHSTVWWFSGSQLYASLISLEDFMDGGAAPLVSSSARRMMRIRPEFFPVAISADKGMAVGIDQDWTLEEHAVIGLSKLPIRAKLYLHNILDHMLSDGAEQDALMYAACFEHLQFFPHAMEILLHEVLEREMDRDSATPPDGSNAPLAVAAAHGNTMPPAVLPRVVGLLENFAAFYDIVVHCARKTEAAFWSRLFECVGGPERFFRQCLANDLLETATQCLIILQTLEPASVNEGNILALLAKVVATKNRDLCLEILRFLKMTAESDPSMRNLLSSLRGIEREQQAQ
ncbi:hypothetical protein GQ54DRAFT_309984 [Martensiomyces pterosporus]|nr:hypothetical protein GQ54DRAFT_309984 [Martensiomyces pterosporus]